MTRKPKRALELGISDELYEELMAKQDGHCALCSGRPGKRRLHVDHNHKTGEVRALLCHRCNRNLPTWVTPAWLRLAAFYLEEY